MFLEHSFYIAMFLIYFSLVYHLVFNIESNSLYPGLSLSLSMHIQNQVVYGNSGSDILWLVDLQYIM